MRKKRLEQKSKKVPESLLVQKIWSAQASKKVALSSNMKKKKMKHQNFKLLKFLQKKLEMFLENGDIILVIQMNT